MKTVTITKRIIKDKAVYHKRFDDYEGGYYGKRISRKEYEASKAANKAIYSDNSEALNIIERITYQN